MTADVLAGTRTATLDRNRGSAGRTRRWRLLAGLLIVAASMVAFVVWNVAASESTPVLVVARPVPMGQPLTGADVQVADVRLAPGVEHVPADQADTVIGRPAAAPLAAGALLAPGHVGAAAMPAAGEVLIAVQVPLPPAGLAPGARVRVLVTPTGPGTTGGGEESQAGVGVLAAASATAVELGPVDGNGARVVSLLVRAADGESVATAAAVGRVVLLVEAQG